MPPKAKFTKAEIIEAALNIVRADGYEALTSRALGTYLGSSARPIFTVFKNMEEVQQDMIKSAKALYKEYVNKGLTTEPPFKGVGTQYILFAVNEPKLFQLLFMTEQKQIPDLSGVLPLIDESYEQILLSIQDDYKICKAAGKKLYHHLWIYTHGIATLCATKMCRFTDEEISTMITEVCMSILKKLKEEKIMIKARNIIKSYQNGESRFQVLKDISLDIEDNDFVVILGASGSGKSTFLNVISGLERPDSGKVFYDGKDITALSDNELTSFRKENVGFIFQQYYLLPNMSVDKNVKMGADLANNKDYKNVIRAVGLGEKLHKYPSELSGGEQQRVSIARALAKRPRVLFLDEPTGALDEQTGRQVLDYICKLQKEYGFTIVMVTHNLNIAEMANTVIKMNSGKISEIYTNEAQKTAYEIGW